MSSSELEDILKQRRNFCEVEPNKNIKELQEKLIAIEKEMQRGKAFNLFILPEIFCIKQYESA